MALIKCKYCEKDISDKATKCPHCGQELIEPVKRVCKECGFEIVDGDVVCNNCGCPVNVKNITEQSVNPSVVINNIPLISFSKKKIGVVILVVLIIGSVVFGVRQYEQQAKDNKYQTNLSLSATLIKFGGEDAITMISTTREVWHNAIYKENDPLTDKYCCPISQYWFIDFNEALAKLYSSSEYITNIAKIQKERELLSTLMNELKEPPEKHKEAYETLKELYTEYMVISNLAIEPTGSLNSYTENCNAKQQNFITLCNKIQIYTEIKDRDTYEKMVGTLDIDSKGLDNEIDQEYWDKYYNAISKQKNKEQ